MQLLVWCIRCGSLFKSVSNTRYQGLQSAYLALCKCVFPWEAVFSQGGLYTLVSGGNDGHTTTLSKLRGGKELCKRERARNAESCGERERELTRTSEFIRHSFVHLGQMFSHLDQGGLTWWHHRERGHCRDLSSNAKPNRPSTLLLLYNTLLSF